MSKHLETLHLTENITFTESKFTVSKLCPGGQGGSGRGVSHRTPWDISKFQGNHKNTQRLVGHCARSGSMFPTNYSYVSFDGVISLRSWVFNSCDMKQALCRVSVEHSVRLMVMST